MSVKERIYQMIDQMPEAKAVEVLHYLEEKGLNTPPLFLTATPEEFERALDSLIIDPAIPVLPDEALSREFIYED